MTPEEYEQWEIDNGLRDEGDRRYIAGLGQDEYQAYLDAGGTPYNPESETFLGVTVNQEASNAPIGFDAAEEAILPPVQDTTPPELMAPIIKEYEADNTRGMKVKFNVLVLDNVDDGLVADCDPNSGAILAIGEHDVYCSAVDSSGNKGEVNFTVKIGIREGIKDTGIIPQIQPMPNLMP